LDFRFTAMDLYFYTFAIIPENVNEGDWVSASSLDTQKPIYAFTKVIEGPENVKIYENGGSEPKLIFDGSLDSLEADINETIIPLIAASIERLETSAYIGLWDIIAIQDDADYDLDESWEYTLGQDEMACPADSAGRLIVSVTPYYSAEVASPGDAALRPPCLANGSESLSEEHMLVAVYMGK
jgi:hypothetical protein